MYAFLRSEVTGWVIPSWPSNHVEWGIPLTKEEVTELWYPTLLAPGSEVRGQILGNSVQFTRCAFLTYSNFVANRSKNEEKLNELPSRRYTMSRKIVHTQI